MSQCDVFCVLLERPPPLSQTCFVSDNQGLTVGILVSILCLLAAGFVVYLKRKTLVRLLFTHKKTTIEKLRYGLSNDGFSLQHPQPGREADFLDSNTGSLG